MKKLKNNMDEMQELTMLRIERRGFYVSYGCLIAAIIIQLLVYGNRAGAYFAGETIAFLASGIYVVAAELKAGLWDRKIPATPRANLLLSLAVSVPFAVVLTIIKYIQYGTLAGAIASGVVFFVYIAIICYAVLTVMLLIYKKRRKTLEEDIEE